VTYIFESLSEEFVQICGGEAFGTLTARGIVPFAEQLAFSQHIDSVVVAVSSLAGKTHEKVFRNNFIAVLRKTLVIVK
jgi:hypothetical protein